MSPFHPFTPSPFHLFSFTIAVMERIVFLERNSVKANFRRPNFEHEWIEYEESSAEEVVGRLKGATIAIVNKIYLHEEELSQLPDLRLIAIAATGTDKVDLDACRKRNIAVCNIRNYARHTLPEHVFMLMLALKRNLLRYREDVRKGKWQEAKQFCLFDYPIGDLHNNTIGIIGYGALGQSVAKIAVAFGMRVLVSEHKDAVEIREGRTGFENLLRESDVISLHCPLNEKTRGLIGKAELSKMKPNAILINTSRGGLVVEEDLAEALKNNLIGGAGFDVLSKEPPTDGNPLLDLDLPNFILTPHNAWASAEAMQALADQLIDNIEAFIKGEPKNLV
jgi:glycerate dehydrogenase